MYLLRTQSVVRSASLLIEESDLEKQEAAALHSDNCDSDATQSDEVSYAGSSYFQFEKLFGDIIGNFAICR